MISLRRIFGLMLLFFFFEAVVAVVTTFAYPNVNVFLAWKTLNHKMLWSKSNHLES